MKVDDVNNSDGKASLKRQKLGTIAQFFHFVAEEKKKRRQNFRMDFDMSSPKIVLLNKV